MSRSTREYLLHILDEATYLQNQVQTLNRAQFLGNETYQRAFVRSLEIIGEATKHLPMDFRESYDHVAWREMAGMRDHLIHGYFGVDYEIVWDVVTNQIPVLGQQIQKILHRL